MQWSPVFECSVGPDGEKTYRVGHELVDEFLEFASVRCRPSTVRAYAHDLKVFFTFVDKQPAEVTPKDVMAFIVGQQQSRRPVGNVVPISDGGSGLSAATVKRRLAAVSSLFGYLVLRGDAGVTANPVPRGIPTRRSRHRGQRGVPLIKGVRRLPRILAVDVLGLRLEDLRVGERQLFIAEGKGGHQRQVPISPTFFQTVADYLNTERPPDAETDRVFVALKGSRRGRPLSVDGLDEVFSAARARAGLTHGTCHELRHTCFTRLKEAGMAIEAIQAMAGHRSIASTRIYLHLGGDWLANEYRRAAEAIDAQAKVGVAS